MLPFSSATNMSRGPTLPMLTGPSHKPIEYTTRNAASKPLFSNSVSPCTISTRNGKPSLHALAPPPCAPAARCATISRLELNSPLNTQVGGREPTHSALFPAIAAAVGTHAGKRQVETRYLETVIIHDARKGVDPLRLDIEDASATAALRMEVVIAAEIVTVRRVGHGDAQHLARWGDRGGPHRRYPPTSDGCAASAPHRAPPRVAWCCASRAGSEPERSQSSRCSYPSCQAYA